VHALCSALAIILPAILTAREEERSARPHDRNKRLPEFEAGYFPA